MSTENKDFKVKHGLVVADGGSFGDSVVVGEPVDSNHATTKSYVDNAVASGITPVRLATTENIDISVETDVGSLLDGVTLVAGNRILIKNQSNPSQNGIYVVNESGPATRALDYNSISEMIPGKSIYVLNGENNTGTLWHLQNYVNEIGTDPLNFIFVGPVKTGIGLIKSSIYEIDINDDVVATLEANQNGVALSSNITISSLTEVGQLSSLSVLGDIVSGDNISGDSATITNNLTAGSLTVTGDVSLTGGDTEIEALTVTGVTEITSLDASGDVNLSGITTVLGEFNVSGETTISNATVIDGTLEVSGVATLGNNVVINGELSLPAGATATFIDTVTIDGQLDINGEATFSDSVSFTADVTIPEPTAPTQPATKNYVDSLLNQESVEIKTLDDLSNYFNGYNSRFQPTYQGIPVTLQNPFNLLLTIDGIIQSVGYPDYVWQSVMPRVGFRIDNDGYIAFPEAIPVGSSFDARILVGSATTTQTKVYPFKAMDIVLGGY